MTADDASYLLSRPEFRRFLFAAIQNAGVLSQHSLADGPQERDLRFNEGRRSLGFELLLMAHQGQPQAIRDADSTGLATLHAAILEALNPAPKEKPSGRRTDRDTARFDELGDE
jgi:hypothetical protein